MMFLFSGHAARRFREDGPAGGCIGLMEPNNIVIESLGGFTREVE